jgi:site-specific DNA recombinase
MSPTLSTARKNRRYRYYVCCSAQRRGWHTCPSKSIPAAQIEKFVVDQVRSIGKDPSLLRQTIESVAAQSKENLMSLDSEARFLSCELTKLPDQRGQLEATRERIRRTERRLRQIPNERLRIERTVITEEEIQQAAAAFSPVWDSLTPREQHRLVDLIVQRVDYHGGSNKIVVTFHETGIKSLASEQQDAP